MRISDQRKNEIIRVFQVSFKRDNSEEIASIGLEELKQADEMLGDRDLNAGFRLALRNRIETLKDSSTKAEQRSYDSKVRAWNIVIGG